MLRIRTYIRTKNSKGEVSMHGSGWVRMEIVDLAS